MKIKANYTGGTIALLIWLFILFGVLIGWVMNIITIANSNFGEITGILILRVVGIFVAPLGAIMGYI